MDRTERLLDLVALFLDARAPVPWAQLRETFAEDYGAVSEESALRKFERDKAELLELGLPLRWVQGEEERPDGYVVDREAYYLPAVDLTPSELAVLYTAGAAALASPAFPGKADLTHALRKVGFLAGELPAPPPVRVEGAREAAGHLAGHLEALWGAAGARKSVTLRYRSPRQQQVTERRVDPYGLALRHGQWTLVGHCHLRGDLRSFLVHRIETLKVNTSRPKSPDFEVPASFRLEEAVASHPWQHRFHPPLPVRLQLTGALAPLAGRLFPPARLLESGAHEGQLLEVEATHLDGLLRVVLSLGPECRVLGPEQARVRRRQMLEAVAACHPVAGGEAAGETGGDAGVRAGREAV